MFINLLKQQEEKQKKNIRVWIEYDSYGTFISGKDIECKDYKQMIKEIKKFENEPECYAAAFPGIQISIMIIDYNQEPKNAAKVFYAVEEAIRYCKNVA